MHIHIHTHTNKNTRMVFAPNQVNIPIAGGSLAWAGATGRKRTVFVFGPVEGIINQGWPQPAVNHCACVYVRVC